MLADVWLYGCESIGSLKGQFGMSKDTRTFVTLVTNSDPLTGLQACHGARNAGSTAWSKHPLYAGLEHWHMSKLYRSGAGVAAQNPTSASCEDGTY